MIRLTNRIEAQKVKQNNDGLLRAGIQPSIDDLRYVKLAEYENSEEDREKVTVNYDPDEWYE